MKTDLNAGAKAKTQDQKLDKELEETFPASDPPSYSAGAIGAGAPRDRESEPKTGNAPEVKDAERKVKTGDAAKPETY